MELAQQLNDCKCIFLQSLSEPEENAINAIILEAKSGELVDRGVVRPVTGLSPIEHTKGCRVFEISWRSYIAYAVRNESYAQNGTDEFEGRLFRISSKSHFLDYVTQATFATPNFPGPFRHWTLACLNHVVEVVSQVEPVMRARIAT